MTDIKVLAVWCEPFTVASKERIITPSPASPCLQQRGEILCGWFAGASPGRAARTAGAMRLEAQGSLSAGDALPTEMCAGAGRRKRRQEGCPGFALLQAQSEDHSCSANVWVAWLSLRMHAHGQHKAAAQVCCLPPRFLHFH